MVISVSLLWCQCYLALSQSFCACAQRHGLAVFENFSGKAIMMSLPVPFMNCVNGGAHADNNPEYTGVYVSSTRV